MVCCSLTLVSVRSRLYFRSDVIWVQSGCLVEFVSVFYRIGWSEGFAFWPFLVPLAFVGLFFCCFFKKFFLSLFFLTQIVVLLVLLSSLS